MSSRKRKERTGHHSRQNRGKASVSHHQHRGDPDAALFVQAYEADIVRGPRAAAAAQSLEVFDHDKLLLSPSANSRDTTLAPTLTVGDALIRWGSNEPSAHASSTFPHDDEEIIILGKTPEIPISSSPAIWLDRYDARLLLESLPAYNPSSDVQIPSSPGGWSDLPSDIEDTFFFTPEETDDFRRDKKRRLLEKNREDRLRARLDEEGESIQESEEEVWGGSDEEPDEAQKELMRRTAQHLQASPNPSQLEMRILANHGSDKRFAFLRGRWKRTWKIVKGKARMEKEMEKQKNQPSGLGGLASYGDSENGSDTGDDVKDTGPDHEALTSDVSTAQNDRESSRSASHPPDIAVIEARRARAKEWAEKRRVMKGI